MKQKTKLQQCIPAALVGITLAAASSLGWAANISYTFDSDIEGWGAANTNTSVVWDSSQGRGSNGCLKYTLTPVPGGTTLATSKDVSIDTANYFGIEFDMLIDPASGVNAGVYGNMQMGDFDAGWSWHSTWYGSLAGPGGKFSSWKHVILPFQTPYGLKEHFQILLQDASDTSNLIVYIDNVVFMDGTPPNNVALYNFAWPDEVTAANTWSATWSHDTTLKPDGALKIVRDYGTGSTAWQDAGGEFKTFENNGWDASKFTYLDFDLYLDAAMDLPRYGSFSFKHWYSWEGIGGVNLSTNNIGKWTHYSIPLTVSSNMRGLVFQPGGDSLSGVITYYIDNVQVWKPATPPKILSVAKSQSQEGGLQITMDTTGNYQRESLCVPAGQLEYSWYGKAPITYSYTITNFPEAAPHYGFLSYIFLVNKDTIPGDAGTKNWNETYPGCDWNGADVLKFTVANNQTGGVTAEISWKTNRPGANPLTNDVYHPIIVTGPTALGTWTLGFTDNTTGYIIGPGIAQTNFTLPTEVADRFNCLESFIQLGAGKNTDTTRNNGSSATFTEFKIEGGNFPVTETFPGPTVTSSGNAWRVSSTTAVQYVSPGTAYWLSWSTPDEGFSMQIANSVTGPYNDAGITQSWSQGAIKFGGVPAATVPAGDALFFRMLKPAAP